MRSIKTNETGAELLFDEIMQEYVVWGEQDDYHGFAEGEVLRTGDHDTALAAFNDEVTRRYDVMEDRA